jgi:hypothetical protein
VKEEDNDAVSLPGQDTETEAEEQTHYCGGSMMHGEHVLDNGDATGIDVETHL